MVQGLLLCSSFGDIRFGPDLSLAAETVFFLPPVKGKVRVLSFPVHAASEFFWGSSLISNPSYSAELIAIVHGSKTDRYFSQLMRLTKCPCPAVPPSDASKKKRMQATCKGAA